MLSILLVAACLRAAITGVGPLLGEIQATTGWDEVRLGALGALPLLVFALASTRVASAAARWGLSRVMLVALLGLGAGIVVRSVGGEFDIWLGTFVLSGAIAVGNVLVPAAVKQDFPHHTTLVTGAYTTVMGGVAAVASGIAVPASALLGGWQRALAVWAVLPVVAAGLWVLTRRSADRGTTKVVERPQVNAWRSPGAWGLTVFFGLQSAVFYTVITWLPTITAASGVSSQTGGWLLMLYQAVGVVGGLAITWWMHRCNDLRLPAATVSVPVALCMLGFALLPDLAALWVIAAAVGSSGSLIVALALIATRTTTPFETAAVSGMAQSVGYLLAAGGPLAGGWIASATGTWTSTLLLVAALAAIQSILALRVARRDPVIRSR